MKQLLLLATALAALPLAAIAAPIQINIGGSNAGATTIAGAGGNLTVSQTVQSGTATDPTVGTVGAYAIAAHGPATFTNAGSGVWHAPAAGYTATFQYDNGANHLTETLSYTTLNNGSLNPHFAGLDVVTAISGSAAFIADFGGVGRTSVFDYTLNAFTVTLEALSTTAGSQTQGISSGELVPNALAPEPASLALLGVGLLGLGMVVRRKRD